jgi:hypothetical protein
MAGRRKSGLDDAAIEELRGRLADGKKPRVQFSGTQFPDGATGTVVRIGDPASDGADFVTVRVTVNGTADELAFAPNELELPGAKRTSQRSAARATAPAAQTKTAPSKAAPSKAAPSKAAPSKAAPSKAAPSKAAPSTAAAATPPPAPLTVPREPENPVKSSANSPADRAPKPLAKPRRKPTSVPAITITIASSDATWSVSATRGTKSITKAAALAPGSVTAIATLLEQQAITQAVAEVNETALAEARERAAQLRAELAELDALLAAHRSPR